MSKKPFPQQNRDFFGRIKCGTGTSPVKIVTYHGTQSGNARGTAAYLADKTTASVHEVHDAREGFTFAADDRVLCGVGGANSGNYHIEDCTFASWARKVWFLNRRTLMFSAYRIARALARNSRRCHFVGFNEAQRAGGVAGLNGWTYHAVLSRTSWCTSTHYDPAANAGMGRSLFPHRWFEKRVRYYFAHPSIKRPVGGKEVRRWLKAQKRRGK